MPRWSRMLWLSAAFAASGAHASDVIHRCRADDGTTVYTDQPCNMLGARPLAPPQPTGERGDAADKSTIEPRAPGSAMNTGGAISLGGVARDDCLRRTDTLLFELRAAIEAQNVNRLASVYDWAGKDTGAAAAILERLAKIASRPLASVEFRYPEFDPFDTSVVLEPVGLPQGRAPAAKAPQERPVGVRIEQLAPGDIEPSFREDLRLVRNADCWWVSF